MAKPNKKAPNKTVDIYCSNCNNPLFKYRKAGKGALLKCFKERIAKDYTTSLCTCPGCDKLFAREVVIRGIPALKIIGGKVWLK
jgi:hypothetical protein